MEVDSSHEVVSQAQDEAANQFRQPPLIDVATEHAKREVSVASNRDHDEPDASENGAHGDEVGEIDRIGIGRAVAQGAKSRFGHGTVARHVGRQGPGGDEGLETLDDPFAGDSDGAVFRRVMTQPREVLGPFGERQGFPEAQRPGSMEVLEHPGSRRGEPGVIDVVVVDDDPEWRVLN